MAADAKQIERRHVFIDDRRAHPSRQGIPSEIRTWIFAIGVEIIRLVVRLEQHLVEPVCLGVTASVAANCSWSHSKLFHQPIDDGGTL
jgi:hypothetical protein